VRNVAKDYRFTLPRRKSAHAAWQSLAADHRAFSQQ
jgi:hypothetical protein